MKTRTCRSECISYSRRGAIVCANCRCWSGETVVIEPEQRTVIREYVVKERVAPVTVKERLSVGATLPADVELRTAPSAWGLSILMTTCTWSSRQTVG